MVATEKSSWIGRCKKGSWRKVVEGYTISSINKAFGEEVEALGSLEFISSFALCSLASFYGRLKF